MLWTLLIIIANNLPQPRDERTFSNIQGRRSKSNRPKTTPELNMMAFFDSENPVQDFIVLVYSISNIFPDLNTRMVLKNVLQDYDLKEVCFFF